MFFTEKAWNQNSDIYSKIIDLPFNKELIKGTLCINKFKNYIIQDSHYLLFFCKALSILASKSNNVNDNVNLLNAAKYVIEEEQNLHKEFFHYFNMNTKDVLNIDISPTCHHYGHFLISLATHSDYSIAISAILPCFKIYYELAKYFCDKVHKSNPYYTWITNYSSITFDHQLQVIEKIINNMEQNSTHLISNEMYKQYRIAFYLEYMFWNSTYILETW